MSSEDKSSRSTNSCDFSGVNSEVLRYRMSHENWANSYRRGLRVSSISNNFMTNSSLNFGVTPPGEASGSKMPGSVLKNSLNSLT